MYIFCLLNRFLEEKITCYLFIYQKASVPVTYLTQEADVLKLASLGESPHKENVLPKTGNDTSYLLTLMGAMLSTSLAGLHFKKNRQKD